MKINFSTMFFVLLTPLLFTLPAFSGTKTFEWKKEEVVSKKSQEIKEILIDVENTCERGCLHKVSSVVEIKLLEEVDPSNFFTWQMVKNGKTVTTFHKVVILEDINGKNVKIISNFPDKKDISRLKKKYKVDHDTIFETTDVTWKIQEVYNEEGEFVHSVVNYHIHMTSDSMWAGMFAGKINSEVKKSAEELFATFNQ